MSFLMLFYLYEFCLQGLQAEKTQVGFYGRITSSPSRRSGHRSVGGKLQNIIKVVC